MASGSTALSLTDIPFVYSLVNIIFIWMYGIENIERFLLVGLIAGILGTFLVFWHPLQFMYNKIMMFRYNRDLSSYLITNPNHSPPKFEIKIEKSLIRLSLKTTSIKYLKDRMVSQDYFIIILLTLVGVLQASTFQKSIHLMNSPYLNWIIFMISAMVLGMIYLSTKQMKEFFFNIKLNSIYFLLTNNIIGFGDASNIIKNAIDLGDWTSVREMIDKQLQSHWTVLSSFSK